MGFSRSSKFFIVFFIFCIAIGSIIVGAGFGMIYAGNRHVTEADMLKEFQPSLPSTLLDIHGDVITEFFAEQKRDIILYPDRDSIDIWKAKAENLHYDRVTVDSKPVTEWWKPEDGEKADIADVVIRMLNNSKPLTSIADVKIAMPGVAPLIDKLNLERASGKDKR